LDKITRWDVSALPNPAIMPAKWINRLFEFGEISKNTGHV
jgi:hypothetical protein